MTCIVKLLGNDWTNKLTFLGRVSTKQNSIKLSNAAPTNVLHAQNKNFVQLPKLIWQLIPISHLRSCQSAKFVSSDKNQTADKSTQTVF